MHDLLWILPTSWFFFTFKSVNSNIFINNILIYHMYYVPEYTCKWQRNSIHTQHIGINVQHRLCLSVILFHKTSISFSKICLFGHVYKQTCIYNTCNNEKHLTLEQHIILLYLIIMDFLQGLFSFNKYKLTVSNSASGLSGAWNH